MNDLYEQILQLAQFTSEVYREELRPDDLERFGLVASGFREYWAQREKDLDALDSLYYAVNGEDGIWYLGENPELPKPVQEFWYLETCLLCCFIRLEISARHACPPQDLEMVEEHIPGFIAYMETHFRTRRDFCGCLDFFSQNLCY